MLHDDQYKKFNPQNQITFQRGNTCLWNMQDFAIAQHDKAKTKMKTYDIEIEKGLPAEEDP